MNKRFIRSDFAKHTDLKIKEGRKLKEEKLESQSQPLAPKISFNQLTQEKIQQEFDLLY
jgi:hypothetical protein